MVVDELSWWRKLTEAEKVTQSWNAVYFWFWKEVEYFASGWFWKDGMWLTVRAERGHERLTKIKLFVAKKEKKLTKIKLFVAKKEKKWQRSNYLLLKKKKNDKYQIICCQRKERKPTDCCCGAESLRFRCNTQNMENRRSERLACKDCSPILFL